MTRREVARAAKEAGLGPLMASHPTIPAAPEYRVECARWMVDANRNGDMYVAHIVRIAYTGPEMMDDSHVADAYRLYRQIWDSQAAAIPKNFKVDVVKIVVDRKYLSELRMYVTLERVT